MSLLVADKFVLGTGKSLLDARNCNSILENLYSKLENPYSILENPYSILENPYSILENPYSILENPYSILENLYSILEKLTRNSNFRLETRNFWLETRNSKKSILDFHNIRLRDSFLGGFLVFFFWKLFYWTNISLIKKITAGIFQKDCTVTLRCINSVYDAIKKIRIKIFV